MNLQDKINEFLDELRESGEINMMGARKYIQTEYPDLTQKEARDYLMVWMQGES